MGHCGTSEPIRNQQVVGSIPTAGSIEDPKTYPRSCARRHGARHGDGHGSGAALQLEMLAPVLDMAIALLALHAASEPREGGPRYVRWCAERESLRCEVERLRRSVTAAFLVERARRARPVRVLPEVPVAVQRERARALVAGRYEAQVSAPAAVRHFDRALAGIGVQLEVLTDPAAVAVVRELRLRGLI